MARKWSEMRADELAELRAATFLLERILEDAQIGRAAAEAESAELAAKLARVEALCDAEDEQARRTAEKYAERGIIDPKSAKPLRFVGIVSTTEVRAALRG